MFLMDEIDSNKLNYYKKGDQRETQFIVSVYMAVCLLSNNSVKEAGCVPRLIFYLLSWSLLAGSSYTKTLDGPAIHVCLMLYINYV